MVDHTVGTARSGIPADSIIRAAPTLAVAIMVHAGWIALTWYHAAIPLPLISLLGAALLAWHGSLQHETIHGHPTAWPLFNRALGSVPLSLWLPYRIYRRSHLAHHATRHVTDPRHDPESHYAASDGLTALALRLERTLIGRMLLGPPIRIGRFLAAEAVWGLRAPAGWSRDWLPHLAAVIPVLWWLHWVGMTPGTYILAFIYPATALTLLRSFAEHRADPLRARRAAIVEGRGLLPLLFLNNNLHAVHHHRPEMPWYRLPLEFRRNRAAYAAAPHYRGYGELVRCFAWRFHDPVIHPDCRRAVP